MKRVQKLLNSHIVFQKYTSAIGYGATSLFGLLESFSIYTRKDTFVCRNRNIMYRLGCSLEELQSFISILELWEFIEVGLPKNYSTEDDANSYTILKIPRYTKVFFKDKLLKMQYREMIDLSDFNRMMGYFDKMEIKKEHKRQLTYIEIDLKDWNALNFCEYIYAKLGINIKPNGILVTQFKSILFIPFSDYGGNVVLKTYIDDTITYFSERSGIENVSPEVLMSQKVLKVFLSKLKNNKKAQAQIVNKTRVIPTYYPNQQRWSCSDKEVQTFAESSMTEPERKYWEKQLLIEEKILKCSSQYRL